MDPGLTLASAGGAALQRHESAQRPAAAPPAARVSEVCVRILLSTYNGARYLPELLDSLDAQSHTNLFLEVRDDGSTDGTLEILEEYARRRPASVHRGAHLGVPASFFHLLRDASGDADLYSFCDQDDVWLPHKVEAAVEYFAGMDPTVPAMYCSSLTPVDAELRPLRGLRPPVGALGFRNALVENRASGCTLVFNRAARALLTRYTPRRAQMHDHWAYLVISAFGKVHYDPEPSLLYRQHGQNRVGMPRGFRSKLRGFRNRRGMQPIFSQAEEFRALYGDQLDPELRAALDRFLGARDGLWRRLGYAIHSETYRQRSTDDLIHRLIIALGLF